MIIVSGRLSLRPGSRAQFLAGSADAMAQARTTAGCRDFVVAADPIEADRVNVYEEWETRGALMRFRGAGPGDDLSACIERAEVAEHELPARPAEPR